MPSTDPAKRRPRITRTAVRTVAGCALFLVWYVGSWLGYWWLVGRGTVRSSTFDPVCNVVFGPIQGYLISGMPGAKDLENLRERIHWQGFTARRRVTSVKIIRPKEAPEKSVAKP